MMPRSACVAALVLIPVLRIALSGLIPGLGAAWAGGQMAEGRCCCCSACAGRERCLRALGVAGCTVSGLCSPSV